MRYGRVFSNGHLRTGALAIAIIAALGADAANSREMVLHNFQGGTDGAVPFSALISDSAGNLYGTTAGGGDTSCKDDERGCGTVFRLAPDGTESVIYAFQGGSDGAFPDSGLVHDADGNFYGTTNEGGASNAGTAFELAPDRTEKVLHAFLGGSDGYVPSGGLIMDGAGNLYGTTFGGGGNAMNCGQSYGCGTVFEIAPGGAETVLYVFCAEVACSDGYFPSGGVIRDAKGNLYGTTSAGGTGSGTACGGGLGCGTLFKVAPDRTETVLYSFQGGKDGWGPESGVVRDKAGNLYGTTIAGGDSDIGTVFKVAPDGTETVLYSFQGGNDGDTPEAGLVMDKAGNLYGTTWAGGSTRCHGVGCGTVFKLAPDGTETVVVAFGTRRGVNPAATLLKGAHGILYGTASAGGTNNDGVVFSLRK